MFFSPVQTIFNFKLIIQAFTDEGPQVRVLVQVRKSLFNDVPLCTHPNTYIDFYRTWSKSLYDKAKHSGGRMARVTRLF